MQLTLIQGRSIRPSLFAWLIAPLVVLAIAILSTVDKIADFMATLQVNTGRAIVTGSLMQVGSGAGHTIPEYLGWGTGAGTTAAADGSLFTEDYSSSNNGTGNTRVAGTPSQITTSTTSDTLQVSGTLTAAHSTATTNAGLFDGTGVSANLTTAPSGNNLYSKGDYAAINLSTNDSVSYTWKIQYS